MVTEHKDGTLSEMIHTYAKFCSVEVEVQDDQQKQIRKRTICDADPNGLCIFLGLSTSSSLFLSIEFHCKKS